MFEPTGNVQSSAGKVVFEAVAMNLDLAEKNSPAQSLTVPGGTVGEARKATIGVAIKRLLHM